ncbi:MAG: hypothetical protein ABW022_08565 [Actinoplanes sp.]
MEYPDPERLIGDWLRDTLSIKVWEDPKPPADKWITAPLAHVQRSPGGDTLALTLDDVFLDCNVYAANADHARSTANRIWSAMTLQLPRQTFQPSGVFVKSSTCPTRPFWMADSKYRRVATYRVILHGLI